VVHHCCYLGGLPGGLGVGQGGSGGISKRGCGLGWSCFISFYFLFSEATAGNHVIKVHRYCCLGGLLGGLCAGRGGLGGISKGGWGLGLSCIISLPCLYVEAATGSHPIEVHYCCYPGGLLGGIGAGRGGLYGLSMLGFAVRCPLFISFLFLHIEAIASNREIEVHRCCYPGGFLGGLGAGRGGLGLIYNIEVAWLVILHLFPLHRGYRR